MFRRFRLMRHQDPSGVSGVGVVAHGCVFPSGKTVVSWINGIGGRTVTVYDQVDDVILINGHGGRTELQFIDKERKQNETEQLGGEA